MFAVQLSQQQLWRIHRLPCKRICLARVSISRRDNETRRTRLRQWQHREQSCRVERPTGMNPCELSTAWHAYYTSIRL